jgi:hypothetical protein
MRKCGESIWAAVCSSEARRHSLAPKPSRGVLVLSVHLLLFHAQVLIRRPLSVRRSAQRGGYLVYIVCACRHPRYFNPWRWKRWSGPSASSSCDMSPSNPKASKSTHWQTEGSRHTTSITFPVASLCGNYHGSMPLPAQRQPLLILYSESKASRCPKPPPRLLSLQ